MSNFLLTATTYPPITFEDDQSGFHVPADILKTLIHSIDTLVNSKNKGYLNVKCGQSEGEGMVLTRTISFDLFFFFLTDERLNISKNRF